MSSASLAVWTSCWGKWIGEGIVASGEWRVASSEWRVASGQWRVTTERAPEHGKRSRRHPRSRDHYAPVLAHFLARYPAGEGPESARRRPSPGGSLPQASEGRRAEGAAGFQDRRTLHGRVSGRAVAGLRAVPCPADARLRHRRRQRPVHLVQHLRQGLPAPMHLDEPGEKPQGNGGPVARGFLYRHGRLHELRTVRRVLPVRRDQDGPQLRAVELRAPSDAYLQPARLAGLERILRQDPSRGLEQCRRGCRAHQGGQEERSAAAKSTGGFEGCARGGHQASASAREGLREDSACSRWPAKARDAQGTCRCKAAANKERKLRTRTEGRRE